MISARARPAVDPTAPPPGFRLNAGTVVALVGLSDRDIERETGLSLQQVFRLFAANEWPAGVDTAQLKATIERLVESRGATPAQLQTLWHSYSKTQAKAMPRRPMAGRQELVGPPRPALHPAFRIGPRPTAAPQRPAPLPEEEPTMLLPKQTLTPAARKHFALSANPFDGEVTTSEEMFCTAEMRFVRDACWQAATGGRFVAVVGESGSGKTTLLADLKERIHADRKPVIVIEPSVLGMEETDARGKVLKAADILTAIVMTLAPQVRVAQTSEKRTRQAHELLTSSTTAGNAHVLLIEEAHALPVATLKHLKRLHERMRLNGRKPMVGILLLGQTELLGTLNDSSHAVREVVQRLELVQLHPLDHELRSYLEFRASTAGTELGKLMTADAVEAIRARLTVVRRGVRTQAVSMVYPLAVNNFATAALNEAAALGVPLVTAEVVHAM